MEKGVDGHIYVFFFLGGGKYIRTHIQIIRSIYSFMYTHVYVAEGVNILNYLF